jgi:hypothetical protein
MGTNIVAFDKLSKNDLAEMQDMFELDDSLVVASGFPVISIKGSKWAVKQGGERTVVTDPDTGDLAPSIEVVIVDYSRNVNKVFYEAAFDEDVSGPPDCYSNDGIKPAADSPQPQHTNCAACPQNQWGAKINKETGKKTKACADTRRLAVVKPDAIDEPMLLRIPPTSLKHLSAYQKEMKTRGVPLPMLVTRLSFDPDASSPMVRFRPSGFINKAAAQEVKQMQTDELVQQIIGAISVPIVEDADDDDAPTTKTEVPESKKDTAPKKKAATKKAAKKPKPEPEPEPEVVDDTDDEDDALFDALDSVLGN